MHRRHDRSIPATRAIGRDVRDLVAQPAPDGAFRAGRVADGVRSVRGWRGRRQQITCVAGVITRVATGTEGRPQRDGRPSLGRSGQRGPPPGCTTPFTVSVYGAYCCTCSVGSS